MADLAASDVTVTIEDHRRPPGQPSRIRAKVTFGDGNLTYPSGGVPLAKGKLGCPNRLISCTVSGTSAAGIVWDYDMTNEKLRAFVQGLTVSATSGTAVNYPLNETGIATASRGVALDNGTSAGTVLTGKLKEMVASTSKPAAQTIYLDVVGY